MQGLYSQDGSPEGLTVLGEVGGNPGEITDLRFVGGPPDPSHIAVATNSSTVRLYSVENQSAEAALYGHTDMVLALDIVPTTQGFSVLASGSKDCTFRLWKIQASFAPLTRTYSL